MKETGYPDIDKPWEKEKGFFKTHPYIPNLSVYNTIKLLNSFYKDNCAVDCLNLEISYRQMFEDAKTISLALKELGAKKGSIISVCMPNFYQAVAVYMACNRIGAVVTFINSSATKKELCDYINFYESKILINFDTSKEDNLNIKNHTGLDYIITLQKNNVNKIELNNNYNIMNSDEMIDYNGLGIISKYKKDVKEKVAGQDDALILYTSGTTGDPKSVILTNKNIVASGIYQKNTNLTKNLVGNKTLVCVPFTYPYGFCTSTLLTLMCNRTAILAPNLSKDNIVYYLEKNPNIVFGSPALLELIMKNIKDDQNLSSITSFVSGGDFLSPQAYERGISFLRRHNSQADISNGSGNAETVSCGTAQAGLKTKPETAGMILVGTDAMIIDPETMERKKINEDGMLCISGEHVFKGYYNDPKRTNDSKFKYNGKTYFKTGTMGSIDKDGYFHISGRLSRFDIISTLNKVYLDHVQSIIASFDCVKDCAVVKVPDDDMLYVNKVYIELNDEYKKMSNDELFEHIRNLCYNHSYSSNDEEEQLMWYEIPKYIEIVPSLPRKHGTEKIDYSTLEKDAYEKKEKNYNLLLKKDK